MSTALRSRLSLADDSASLVRHVLRGPGSAVQASTLDLYQRISPITVQLELQVCGL